MVLTPRLACIAALVPQDARLADVGTDHGKLPLSLLIGGRIRSAIGSDIGEGPLSHAARNAAEHGVKLCLRLAQGLDAVRPDECGVITVAGMGGQTISEILSAAPWTADGKHLLLLQPMTMLYELRQWLWANGYAIERETLCREGRRWYAVFSARGGAEKQLVPLPECTFSPALLRAEGAKEYLSHLLRRETRALEGMERGTVPSPTRLAEQRETVHRLQQALNQEEFT